jgi:hypothetical protein
MERKVIDIMKQSLCDEGVKEVVVTFIKYHGMS